MRLQNQGVEPPGTLMHELLCMERSEWCKSSKSSNHQIVVAPFALGILNRLTCRNHKVKRSKVMAVEMDMLAEAYALDQDFAFARRPKGSVE